MEFYQGLKKFLPKINQKSYSRTIKYRRVLNFGLYTAISLEGRLSRIFPHLAFKVG